VALLTARSDRSRALDWIQIGAMAGPTIELPSVALRSANFRLQGSGQGSVSPRAYLAELPSLVDEITTGAITIQANEIPLSAVERAWTAPETPRRADGPRPLTSQGPPNQPNPPAPGFPIKFSAPSAA
jgi:hypothetical protein